MFSATCAGCLGPGVEPPDNGGSAPIGGAGAGQSGTGGSSGASANPTAGVGGFNAGAGGLNPAAGSGGLGGSAGTSPSGGFGGMNGMGGAGGSGGMGVAAGMGGTGGEAGAGVTDGGTEPEAPALECEEGRDTVMLLEAALIGLFPYCTAELPNEASLGTPTMALAVTSIDPGSAMDTTWAGLKNGADECDEGQAFYVDPTLAVPRITLCPAFCEALIATGVENVKLELIYGCEPPE